jgi:aspartate/methionine/tyrosine aminotransferase
MINFQPFELERIQSTWEQKVEFNMSESGVHPVNIEDLVSSPDAIEDLLSTSLGYPEVNGTPLLRERIAALYPGATEKNVMVTIGCIEANAISLQTLVNANAGDEVVVMVPNYLQIWGLAHNLGMVRRELHLREENGWAPDLDELEKLVTNKTKAIAICNPNNPTGRILTEAEMDRIIRIADRVGAWIIADEVYRGAERLQDEMAPTFWGKYERVFATASLSKAYGLPGLRLGWVVCPQNMYDSLWMRHEYLTISATATAMKLAEIALSPEVRPRLNVRARKFIRRGYPVVENWLNSHPGLFRVVPPQAAAIAFVRYNMDINSTELARRLIEEKSVFIVPGDSFGMDHFFRIGTGQPRERLTMALERIHELIVSL